jgi:hypothetical protein
MDQSHSDEPEGRRRVLFSCGEGGDQAPFRLPRREWDPGRIMVLSEVGMCGRMVVSEALAS